MEKQKKTDTKAKQERTIKGTTGLPDDTQKNELSDKWFNVEDIAEYLSITPDTARQWVREGKLPAYKAGKRYKLKLSEVDEWVRSGKITE